MGLRNKRGGIIEKGAGRIQEPQDGTVRSKIQSTGHNWQCNDVNTLAWPPAPDLQEKIGK